MKKEDRLHIRIGKKEKEWLENESKTRQIPMSAIINDVIKARYQTDLSNRLVLESLAETTARNVRDLAVMERTLSNVFLRAVQLFMFATPEIKEGYEKTKEFKYAGLMTNKWFERMLNDIHDFNPDFFGQIEDVLMVRGEMK